MNWHRIGPIDRASHAHGTATVAREGERWRATVTVEVYAGNPEHVVAKAERVVARIQTGGTT